ncbi:MAG TPA: family 1 glycosylhydrolase, partial [Planctomycetota bacterium]|nr:family 1 glycosylhydrolase [Planctomycetota bacterium]
YAYLPPVYGTPHYDVREYDVDAPHSDMWQEIAPEGLRHVIEAFARYKLPMVISENGIGDDKDDRRALYLLEHLYVLGRAIADGYDVRGYYYWTISDNFEWDNGLDARFGLFSVDFSRPDFPRTRTRGADVFEGVARSRRIDRALWERFWLPAYPVGRR